MTSYLDEVLGLCLMEVFCVVLFISSNHGCLIVESIGIKHMITDTELGDLMEAEEN